MKHLLLWVALCWGLTACSPPQPFHHTDLSGATFAAEFPRALADQGGQPRRLADFRGRVVILFFGYTSCPDVCPTTLAELKAAVEALPAAQRRQVQVLFVTLDPERDHAALLREYVAAFAPQGGRPFLGLWGGDSATADLIRELQLVAERQPSESMGYTLDHTAGVFLFDKAGVLRLTAQSERSQLANKRAALERFVELLRAALVPPPPPRRKTRPSFASRLRRLEGKRRRAAVKSGRRGTSSGLED